MGALVEADVREDAVLGAGLLDGAHFFAVNEHAFLCEAGEELVVLDWGGYGGLL